jgi:hypothetical protein
MNSSALQSAQYLQQQLHQLLVITWLALIVVRQRLSQRQPHAATVIEIRQHIEEANIAHHKICMLHVVGKVE